jgi:hypothetical protein
VKVTANHVFIQFHSTMAPTLFPMQTPTQWSRFPERDGKYSIGSTSLARKLCLCSTLSVLKPEEHQPSGTCNFSRIDGAARALTLTPTLFAANATVKIRVYAGNQPYVLRVAWVA